MQIRYRVGYIMRIIIFILCVCATLCSILAIVKREADLSRAQEVYDVVLDEYTEDLPETVPPLSEIIESDESVGASASINSSSDDSSAEPELEIEKYREYIISQRAVKGIQEKYPECMGFITVSGTNISYPVMKSTTNNDYYLSHLYNGEESRAGSIFCDFQLLDDYDENLNVVVYGHDMTDGSMFRAIKLFFDNQHRAEQAKKMEITFVTEQKVYIYRFFSGYRSETNEYLTLYARGSNPSDFHNFLNNVASLNSIPINTSSYDSNSRIITLVTCTNLITKPNERYVLHGILAECYVLP